MTENTTQENFSKTRNFGFLDMFFRIEPEHRIGRMDYFLRLIAWKIITVIIIGFFAYVLSEYFPEKNSDFYKNFIGAMLLVPTFFIHRALMIKRVQDFQKNLTLVNFYLFLVAIIFLITIALYFYMIISPLNAFIFAMKYDDYIGALAEVAQFMNLVVFVLLFIPSKNIE